MRDERGIEKVRGVSFDVRAGEIVGIAGVDGNGQTELIDAITGLMKSEGGTITVAGQTLHNANAREMLDAGVGHIPEDRQRRGLVLEFSIAENIALHDYAEPPTAKRGWLFPNRMVDKAKVLIREFDVRGGGPLDARRRPLGRQSAEARRRARDLTRPEALDRRAADPWARRGRDRVPAPPHRHRARPGPRRAADLARTGGDPLALRPHSRALRGRDRR